MQISLKQVASVADQLLLRTTTDPAGSVVTQIVLGQKTFTEGTETDRTIQAPDTPGRFDSSSTIAAMALFGAEGVGDLTAGVGFWGGPAAPTGSMWWVPDNPFNQDYGHFTLRQSRNDRGFDPVSNNSVLTGPAGVEAYYLQVPMGRTVASPGTTASNYITDSGALWPPSEVGYAKLFSRPGPSPYFDYADREPALAVTTRDLNGTVRTETLLTVEKAATILSPYLQSPDLPPAAAPSPLPILYRTTDFTVAEEGMYVVYASPSPVVVTLAPTATSDLWTVDIKKIDQSGNSVTVQVDSSPELIDFSSSFTLTGGGDNLTIRCDSTRSAWWSR